MKKAP